jgi:hypothetical protein
MTKAFDQVAATPPKTTLAMGTIEGAIFAIAQATSLTENSLGVLGRKKEKKIKEENKNLLNRPVNKAVIPRVHPRQVGRLAVRVEEEDVNTEV